MNQRYLLYEGHTGFIITVIGGFLLFTPSSIPKKTHCRRPFLFEEEAEGLEETETETEQKEKRRRKFLLIVKGRLRLPEL
ncbi:hypothetical protein EPH95_18545 [Salicibibacter halophilus]|uniref:Uncharacterized protein n=1 Tax=Salicibibacter halophilus TaxID=2502791 RepID=A0A514LM47_9BACI|nr:hypothetical protein [Salicibibacter halophilus]QDI92916.1 hypothetical protein EPH95_18545 [Salicibibacter halophilus]